MCVEYAPSCGEVSGRKRSGLRASAGRNRQQRGAVKWRRAQLPAPPGPEPCGAAL